MIQFNLLPDVKLEYIKTQRTKHIVMVIGMLASAASLVVFSLLVLTVDVWQHKTLNDLSSDIKKTSEQLKSTPDLNKILTVQSQLGSLSTLHGQKPAAQRLFGYLAQVTPDKATISDMTVDYTQNTLSISGKAPTLDVVNTFTDGLKFTKYQVKGSDDKLAAFSNVVLSSFGRSEEGAIYTITLSFDPTIFSNASPITLDVPNIVTTRSVVEQPSVLFDGTNTLKGAQ